MLWVAAACGLIIAGAGCASKTMRVEIPASPAVQLPAAHVAVVVRERSCQGVADALTRVLRNAPAIHVEPRAATRLELFACGDDQAWTVQEHTVQALRQGRTRRRTLVVARAHAVLAVVHDDRVVAHLLGAGRDHYDSTGHRPPTAINARNRAKHRAVRDLVGDLRRQLDPTPMAVQRRIYPRAAVGTAKAFTTLAVRAEQSGDVPSALQLAQAALARDPRSQTAGYIVELRRRMATQ